MTSAQEIKEHIAELKADSSFPKNVRETLTKIENLLSQNPPDIHKALQELEEIVDASDLESFVRTQLWDLMSVLESIS